MSHAPPVTVLAQANTLPVCSTRTYSGSISFVAPNHRYVWYTVQVSASRPPAEGVVQIDAEVRQAVAAEIGISNPLSEPVEFEVRLEGDGLLGDPFLMLGPKETATYELIYSPLTAGERTGSITFSNEVVGEFWYNLSLKSIQPAPKHVPDMVRAVRSLPRLTTPLTNSCDRRARSERRTRRKCASTTRSARPSC